MILMWKIFTLVAGLALTVCLSSNAYSDAESIARISDSIGQNVATQSWDAVDAGYEELYAVYQSDYGVGSRQALAMAKVLGQWKIQAFRSELMSKSPGEVIADASEFYTGLIAEVEQQQGVNASDLIDPLYGQAIVEYHLLQIEARKPVNSYRGIGPEIIEEERCEDAEDRGGAVDCEYMEVPSQDYIQSQVDEKNNATTVHREAVETSLQRIAAICKQNQYLLDEAEVMTHLGDYYLYHREQSAAIEAYSSAYQLLATNADPDAAVWMQRLFTATTVVPSLATTFAGAAPAPITTNGITFGFNIGSDGKADEVEVLSGASRNNRAEQQSAIRIISGATFRPRFDEEGVVESASVEI